jgi:serine/threonine-protein phosphatase PPG1
MKELWPILFGLILILIKKNLQSLQGNFIHVDISIYTFIKHRGAGYMFGSLVVERFLHMNNMSHILRAHQLCNAGYQVLFNDKLSTVWSAPNYCYRCGNLASILEVGVYGERYFNVFDAAPENERILDGNDTYGKVNFI